MAKQLVKKRRHRRLMDVRVEKNMQNSQERRHTNLQQSSIYKQKSYKRHLKRLHATKQQCGGKLYLSVNLIFLSRSLFVRFNII